MNAIAAHSAATMVRHWFVVTSLMLGVVFVPLGVTLGVQSAYRLAAAQLRTPTRTEQLVRTMESMSDEGTEFDVTATPRKMARR